MKRFSINIGFVSVIYRYNKTELKQDNEVTSLRRELKASILNTYKLKTSWSLWTKSIVWEMLITSVSPTVNNGRE